MTWILQHWQLIVTQVFASEREFPPSSFTVLVHTVGAFKNSKWAARSPLGLDT